MLIDTSTPLWITLAGPVLSFVGAMAGGALALRRHREQHAFDRRADWYERAFRALSAAGSLFRDYRVALASLRHDPLALNGYPEKFDESAVAVRLVWDEAPLFASEETTRAIRQAAAEIARMATPTEPVTIDGTIRDVTSIIEALSTAMLQVIEEHRSHIGLPVFRHEDARSLWLDDGEAPT